MNMENEEWEQRCNIFFYEWIDRPSNSLCKICPDYPDCRVTQKQNSGPDSRFCKISFPYHTLHLWLCMRKESPVSLYILKWNKSWHSTFNTDESGHFQQLNHVRGIFLVYLAWVSPNEQKNISCDNSLSLFCYIYTKVSWVHSVSQAVF